MTEQSKKLFALEIAASVHHGKGTGISQIISEANKIISYLNESDEREKSKETAQALPDLRSTI